jgi:alpha-L-fucosidase
MQRYDLVQNPERGRRTSAKASSKEEAVFTRRTAMKAMAGALPALGAVMAARAASSLDRAAGPQPGARIESGPYQPSWESLVQQYRCPDWFRDAKFGIWAHWSAQCVPEQGDWYARQMYIQGHRQHDFHVRTYGHPSTFGFMEIENLWKADKWEPGALMALYKRAGARYFVSLANHHDNFDAYDSKYHSWNSVNVGPKKDIVGTWARLARASGLRFGVSNHSAHSWHWFQTAYGYDGEGPRAGVRYDGFTLRKADGKGRWWEGLDPQDLYTGRNLVMPDGLTSAKAVADWHEKNDRPWTEKPPDVNPGFVENWFLRCKDLVDKYRPDLLYFDNIGELPLGQAGLDLAAHFYNASVKANGAVDAVLNVKGVEAARRPALVEDYERGASDVIQPAPWQTDTCIGEWHYNRSLFEQHRYKTVARVVRTLVNVVSKNGNLLLSVPLRGDGTIDEDEAAFLEGMAEWIGIHGEGIYGTRPWKIAGEGPTRSAGGMFNEGRTAFSAEDVRFTTKSDTLFAFLLGWPAGGSTIIKALASGSPLVGGRKVTEVSLLGYAGGVQWTQNEQGLTIRLPDRAPSEHAVAVRIKGIL